MDFRSRIAAAALSGFVSFVITLPIACGGLILCGEHVNGDVQSAGPQAILGGMALAGVLGVLVAAFVMIKTGGQQD